MMTLQEAVDRLPDTPDQIALLLRWLGIKGDMGACRTCPLAMYFEKCTGTATWVGDAVIRNDRHNVNTPYWARVFIYRVDDKYYPEVCR
jgi:hypothetical protein